MSKKRFILAEDSNGLYSIFDTKDKEDEPLIYGAKFGTEKIVDLLNEQQEMIDQLEKENTNLIELAEELGVKIEVVDDE